MSRQIIILDQHPTGGNAASVNFVMWATVPLARQSLYAKPGFLSEYVNATVAELTALRTGAITERVDNLLVPKPVDLPATLAILQARWQTYQDSVNNDVTFARYGSSWDGTSWTTAAP